MPALHTEPTGSQPDFFRFLKLRIGRTSTIAAGALVPLPATVVTTPPLTFLTRLLPASAMKRSPCVSTAIVGERESADPDEYLLK